jgi:Ca2+-binding RTX toxin-like protein
MSTTRQPIGTEALQGVTGGSRPTEGHDNLTGTSNNDTLTGLGGNDTLHGGNAQDVLTGGAGHDHLSGGDGDDLLAGGTGHDSVAGGTGQDRIFWHPGDGNDTIDGGGGDDTLVLEDIAGQPMSITLANGATMAVTDGMSLKGLSGTLHIGQEKIEFRNMEKLDFSGFNYLQGR